MSDTQTITKIEQRYLDQLAQAGGDRQKLWTRKGGLWTLGNLKKVEASLKAKGLL